MASLSFRNDGQFLAAGGRDGLVRVSDLRTDKQVARVFGTLKTVSTIDFSPDGTHLAYGSYDDKRTPNVRVVSIPNGEAKLSWPDNPRGVFRVCFNPKGDRLAVLGPGQTINIYDVSTLRTKW